MKIKKFGHIILLVMATASMLLLNSCAFFSEESDEQRETERIVLTTIAVVNSDMGVETDGERINYSAAIIETLDANFVLVSPAMAESGFDSGAYGAIITFPSDVSSNIVSFNALRPRRVQLEFRINPDLAEADYIDLHRQIMNLQVSINTTLAHTYVSSMLMQFHAAQNHADTIFSNNHANLYAVDIVRLPAFSSTLELDELPYNPFEMTPSDAGQFMDDVSGFAESVASLFQDSYTAASEQYLSMREGLFELIRGLPDEEEYWITQLMDWSSVIEQYGEEVSEFSEIAEEYATELLVWHDELEKWHYEADYWYDLHRILFDETIEYIEQLHEYVEFLYSNIEPVSEKLQKIHDDLELSIDMLREWRGALDAVVEVLEVLYDVITPYIDKLYSWHGDLESSLIALQSWHYELDSAADILGDWNSLLLGHVYDLCDICRETVPKFRGDLTILDWHSLLSCHFYELCADCRKDLPIFSIDITIPGLCSDFSLPEPKIEIKPEIFDIEVPELCDEFEMPEFAYDFHIPTAAELFAEIPEGELPSLPKYSGMEEPPHIEIIQLSEIAPKQPDAPQPPRPDDFFASVDSLHGQLSLFNVDDFLGEEIDNIVAGMLGSYMVFLDMISSDLDIQFEVNINELTNVRYEYRDHLLALRLETLRGEADEQERLREYLATFIYINEQNNSDTHELLSGFSRMMPESRTQAGLNRGLVEFTVAPFEFVLPEVRQSMAAAYNLQIEQVGGYMRHMTIVVVAIGLALITVSLLVLYIYKMKKQKRQYLK